MVEKKCDYCDKVINGANKKQLDYLILQHKISKHPDKIKITEEEDGNTR